MRLAFLLASVVAGWLGVQPDKPSLDEAQRLFYNGRFADSAALCVALRSGPDYDFENDELRTSALLFQMRRLLDRPRLARRRQDGGMEGVRTAARNCWRSSPPICTTGRRWRGRCSSSVRATSGRCSTSASSI